jgi:tetratricopeptide (TPR) repeat protein
MLMRRMMAVMLLGIASLSSAYGQRRPARIQSNEYQSSNNDPLARLNTFGVAPDLAGTKTEGSGIVSVQQLKLPEKALKEVHLSDKALLAGDLRGSTEHLEKAVAIDPKVAAWHNGLGSRYTALKEYDEAIREYQAALELDAKYQEAAENIAAVRFEQRRYEEAERAARRALEMDPSTASSQYLLGSVLVEEGRYFGEATELLQKAQAKYPQAGLFLGIALEKTGRIAEAEEALRGYLRAGGKSAKVAQEWLEELEKRDEGGKKATARMMADDE